MTRNRPALLVGASLICTLAATPSVFADGVQSQSTTYMLPAQQSKAPANPLLNEQELPGLQSAQASPPLGGGSKSVAVTATQTSKTPNSDNNYLDDRLLWDTKIAAKADPKDESPSFCFPRRTRLLGHKSTLDTVTRTANGATGSTPTQSEQYLQVILDPEPVLFGLSYPPQAAITAQEAKDANCSGFSTDKPPQAFNPGDIAYVSNTDLGTLDFRSGIDYGALVVPFKLQTTGKGSFTSSASVGGYVGYRIPWMDAGVAVSPVVFAGVSNISTSIVNGGKTTSQTLAGLSYGAGLLFTIKNSIQVGAVVGFDHVDAAQPYAYNDKPWISFEIGYSFAQ